MINYEEELKKFKPCLDVDEIESAVYTRDLTDIVDILQEIVANVPPNCFMPRPKVGSAVIRLTRHAETPVQVDDEKLLFQIIRASFNQRRKTLANGLKNYEGLSFEKETIEAAIAECGFSPSVRGEALSLEEFAKLANVLRRAK